MARYVLEQMIRPYGKIFKRSHLVSLEITLLTEQVVNRHTCKDKCFSQTPVFFFYFFNHEK